MQCNTKQSRAGKAMQKYNGLNLKFVSSVEFC